MWGQSKEDGGELGSAVCWGSFLPMSTQVGCPGHSTAPFKTPKRVGPPLCHQGNPHWDGTGLVERVPGWEGGNVFQSCPGKAQARVGESEGGCPLRGGAAAVKTLDLHTGGQADVWKGTEQEDRASPPDSGLCAPRGGSVPSTSGGLPPAPPLHTEARPGQALAPLPSSHPPGFWPGCPCPHHAPGLSLARPGHSLSSQLNRAPRNFSLPPPLPPSQFSRKLRAKNRQKLFANSESRFLS